MLIGLCSSFSNGFAKRFQPQPCCNAAQQHRIDHWPKKTHTFRTSHKHHALTGFLNNRDPNYVTLISLAIASTFTTGLGIPCVIAYLLYRNRNIIRSERRDRATEVCLGFLYGCFKPTLYWFEMAWLVRRLLLSPAVIPEDDVFQAPSIVSILVVSLVLHHTLKPLKDPRENLAEGLGLLALLVTFTNPLLLTRRLQRT